MRSLVQRHALGVTVVTATASATVGFHGYGDSDRLQSQVGLTEVCVFYQIWLGAGREEPDPHSSSRSLLQLINIPLRPTKQSLFLTFTRHVFNCDDMWVLGFILQVLVLALENTRSLWNKRESQQRSFWRNCSHYPFSCSLLMNGRRRDKHTTNHQRASLCQTSLSYRILTVVSEQEHYVLHFFIIYTGTQVLLMTMSLIFKHISKWPVFKRSLISNVTTINLILVCGWCLFIYSFIQSDKSFRDLVCEREAAQCSDWSVEGSGNRTDRG